MLFICTIFEENGSQLCKLMIQTRIGLLFQYVVEHCNLDLKIVRDLHLKDVQGQLLGPSDPDLACTALTFVLPELNFHMVLLLIKENNVPNYCSNPH